MPHLDATLAAATALLAPLRDAVAAGALDQAGVDRIRPLVDALDAAVRTDRVDHGDVQRGLLEALDIHHEWWSPRDLQSALAGVEYAVRAATDGTIERTWHPSRPTDHNDDVGQQGFDWGFHDWAAKAWHGGFADEPAARVAYEAHRATR